MRLDWGTDFSLHLQGPFKVDKQTETDLKAQNLAARVVLQKSHGWREWKQGNLNTTLDLTVLPVLPKRLPQGCSEHQPVPQNSCDKGALRSSKMLSWTAPRLTAWSSVLNRDRRLVTPLRRRKCF